MGNDLTTQHSLDKLKERKEKYKLLITLINKGHSYSSAARKVGFSPKHVSLLVKKPYFKRKLAESEEILKGRVKASLVKRALGYDKTETKVVFTKNGPEEVEELKHYPGDVKAQLAYLSAKDKEGGWTQSTTNIQINQQLQGVTTQDLLLTLQSSKGGGEGVLTATSLPPSQPTLPDLTSSHPKVYNPDNGRELIDELRQAQEGGEGMSDEEYLSELVQAPEEN